jgi:ribonuclease Z
MLSASVTHDLLIVNHRPGLFMSVADSSPRIMEVVGPRGLLHFFASMRFYAFRFVWYTPLYVLHSKLYGRNTLRLKVAEVPSFGNEPQKEATPVFRDDNITVFSIPVTPAPHRGVETTAQSEALSETSENVLKRKREHSPDSPSKRPLLDAAVSATDGPTIPSTSPPLIDRYLDDPQFDPSTLEGEEADSWRRLIIEHMFTWVEPPPKPLPSPKLMSKRGKRGRDPENREGPETLPPQSEASLASLPQAPHWVEDTMKSQAEPPRRTSQGASPAGSLRRLPTFATPVHGLSTAYIVVGPRVRGKFDAKRAEELGLYGPLRGKVVRGETVSFAVDDGAGGKVQRTVRPEDCMGDHETTKVSLPLVAVTSLMC